jgi:hypothetical protein
VSAMGIGIHSLELFRCLIILTLVVLDEDRGLPQPNVAMINGPSGKCDVRFANIDHVDECPFLTFGPGPLGTALQSKDAVASGTIAGRNVALNRMSNSDPVRDPLIPGKLR